MNHYQGFDRNKRSYTQPARSCGKVPRVSIGLPVYNGEEYISLAIESVLAQTYDQLELVISDNGSTDATKDICCAYAEQDKRIHYLRSEANLGAAWNYNRVFLESRGEYFRWLAHDDMLDPTTVEKSVFILDSYPKVVLCFTWSLDIDEQGSDLKIKKSTREYAAARTDKRFFSMAVVVPWHNCEEIFGMIRSGVLNKSSLMRNYPDSDRTLLAELALFGPFYEIPEPLFFHRIHGQSSVRANPELYDQALWFDTSLSGKLLFPRWRQFFELVRVASRGPLSSSERFLTYLQLIRWSKRRRKHLFADFQTAVNHVRSANTQKRIR